MIPKTPIEYFKQEKNKHTKPYHTFYDTAILALEKEALLAKLEESGIFIKILHMERLEEGEYFIVYTKNPFYIPKTKVAGRSYLEEGECDILASDIAEAAHYIPLKLQKEKQANADRIKHMNAHEIAVVMNASNACDICDYCDKESGVCSAVKAIEGTEKTVGDCCIEATEKWLNSEYKEGEQ